MGCSGTIVSSERDNKTGEVSTYVLTAKHCVDEIKTNTITENPLDVIVPVYEKNEATKKEVFKAYLYGKHVSSDLALLKLDSKDIFFDNVVTLAPKDVTLFQGEDVLHVGYPITQTLTITAGKFVSRENLGNYGELFKASAQGAPGSSGGPLFHKNNKGDWEQIGVVCCGSTQHDFLVYYTPIDMIRDYLDVAIPSTKEKTE